MRKPIIAALAVVLTGTGLNLGSTRGDEPTAAAKDAGIASEEVTLPSYVCSTQAGDQVQAAGSPFTLGDGTLALLWFDEGVLREAGSYTVESATLELSVRGHPLPAGGAARVSVAANLHPFVKADGSESGEIAQDKTVATFPLTKASIQKGLLKIDLPANDPSLAEGLKNGFVVEFQGAGPVILGGADDADRPKLLVSIRPREALKRLDLEPATPIVEGQTVTRQGDEFVYNGKPIRFWGDNVETFFTSYPEVDAFVKRYRNMGFNAVRLWAGYGPDGYNFYSPASAAKKQLIQSHKGDGSGLDLYDYAVSRFKAANIFVFNPSLFYFHRTRMLKDWPDLPAPIPASMADVDFDILPYINDGYMDVILTHMRNYLGHVNPWTGKRNADDEVNAIWQLNNENQTVAWILSGRTRKWPEPFKGMLQHRWNAWLCHKYTTRAALESAWGELGADEDPTAGTVQPAPIYPEAAKFPAQRGNDFVAFAEDCFISGSKKMEQVARSMASGKTGIAVAPITANANNSFILHSLYAVNCLDFSLTGAYSRWYTTKTASKHYPWVPIVSNRPVFLKNNMEKIEGMPVVIYETAPVGPYPYRAETMPALTLMGATSGLNGVFLFVYGQPSSLGFDSTSDLNYSAVPVQAPRPKSLTPGAKMIDGMTHAADEVYLASALITGQAFLNGIPLGDNVTRVTYGEPALEGLAYQKFDVADSSPPSLGNLDLGLSTDYLTYPKLYREMVNTSFRGRMILKFDPTQQEPIHVEGTLAPEIDPMDKVSPSDGVTWDAPGERIILDTPQSKIVVGFIRNGYSFKDGIRLGPINRDFALFGIASRDGLPLTRSRDILLVLTSTSANTGFEFDPTRIKGEFTGNILGVVKPGRPPVMVDRVAGEVDLPGITGTATRYNFAGFGYKSEKLNGKMLFSDQEPLFVARIQK